MTTPYDKQIADIGRAEANRGLSASEDSQLQRLKQKREGWQDRDPEVVATKAVIIKEFCDGLKERWYDEKMGWSLGPISEIADIVGDGI